MEMGSPQAIAELTVSMEMSSQQARVEHIAHMQKS
jgi:hypothetical protein